MCVGENCAQQAACYVKAQLSALYKNAVDCLRLHDPYGKAAEKSRFSHALREFTHYSSRRKPLFQGTFCEPQLEFICNHDVVLQLHIESGIFVLDDSKSVIGAPGKDRVQVEDVALAFRVPFYARRLDGSDLKYNNGYNPLQLLVLDYARADVVSEGSYTGVGREALARYLKEYLLFLAEAGNHVFFSVPCSDDDRSRLMIDYSTMEETRTTVELSELYGVSTDKINEYLSSAWLKAKLAIGSTTDWKSYCLAEYRSTCGVAGVWDTFFHLRMHPPRLQPLCSNEAIVYFSVDEVLFYEDADFTKQPRRKFNSWDIAIVANVVHHEEFDGCVTRCMLDLFSARSAPIYCRHDSFAEDDELAETSWAHIVEFFSSTYLQVLETASLHVVYYFDSRWPTAPQSSTPGEEEIDEDAFFEAEEGDEGSKVIGPAVVAWKEEIKESSTSGFDRVMVTAQSALNKFFGFLWSGGKSVKHRDHSLVEWKYTDCFEARLLPLTLRLLSNERAIVWVHLEEGSFQLLENPEQPSAQTERYHFEGWHLAFEVDLKKIVHSSELESSQAWIARFKDSLIFREHGNRADRTLEYIVLDLETEIEFLFEYSSFEGLFHQADHSRLNSSADQVLAIVHYLRNYYFVDLVRCGLNILQAIPVRKPDTDAQANVSLTTVEFDVCAPGPVTRDNWAHASGSAEPVITVVGMTDCHPAPPSGRLEYTPGLTTRAPGSASFGTVCLARAEFLDKCVLDVLSGINARTTLIPLFTGFVNGRLELFLSTWAENKWKAMQTCGWEEAYIEEDGVVEYKWERHDYWDTGETNRFNYTVSCLTRNVVRLPIAARTRCLDIKVSGETSLAVSYKSAAQEESSQAAARWSTTISIRTGSDGLSIADIPPIHPAIAQPPAVAPGSDKTLPDLSTKLQEQLPDTIDFAGVLARLKAFEGPWKQSYIGMHACALAHPVFNRAGDVIFELHPQAQGAASSAFALRSSLGAGAVQNGVGGSGSGQASLSRSSDFHEENSTSLSNGRSGVEQGHIIRVEVEERSEVLEIREEVEQTKGDANEADGSDTDQETRGPIHNDGETTEEEY